MSDEVFRSVSKKLGLGCMRFPLTSDGAIDIETVKKMVDLFIKEGFNYFDTAHGYLNGRSEGAVKEALTSRYPRESYLLADKLSNGFFKKEEDIRPLFESQLAQCGVGYFDYYLMHALDGESYKKYCSTNAFTVASRLKEEGKIRHVGISFHDSADVLRKKNIPFTGGVNSPYIWFECPNGMESWEFFDYLLTHAQVVGTPGAGFGENGKNYFRLTAFGQHESTAEAMRRFEELF